MKKKLFVILMSLTLAITMMPLSVFAEEESSSPQGEEVVTPIGETGLFLTGPRAAELNNDYNIEAWGGEINVFLETSGWKVSGDAEDVVLQYQHEGSLEFGDTKIKGFIGISQGSYNSFTINGDVISQHQFAFAATNVEISGNGSLTVIDGTLSSLMTGPTTNLKLNVSNVNVTQNENTFGHGPAIYAQNVNILGGNVVARSLSNIGFNMNMGIASSVEPLSISPSANVFASGNDAAVASSSSESFDLKNCSGHPENLSFEEKDQVDQKTEVVDYHTEQFEYKVLAIAGTNAIAKSFVNKAPTPDVFNVTFKYQDGTTEDLVKEVVEGEKVARPEDPVREGYTFEGWYDNLECEGSSYDFDSPVLSDAILYAKWTSVEPGPTPGPTPPTPPTPPVNPGHNTGHGGIDAGDSLALPIGFVALGLLSGLSVIVIARKSRCK